MPGFDQLYPFLILGLAFGALYAVAATGLVVLYRTTGVLNFAFGAIGMFGLNVSWSLLENPDSWCPRWAAYCITVALSVLISLAYGLFIAPKFANREPLIRTIGTLGLLLLLLGITYVRWETQNGRTFSLPMKQAIHFNIGKARINGVHLFALLFGIAVTLLVTLFLNKTALGTAMRAVANDRDVAALIGVPVRRVEAIAWAANGFICGVVALCAGSLLSFDVVGLTYIVISYLAAALIGRLRNLGATFAAGIGIGVVEAGLTPFNKHLLFLSENRGMAPFVLCIIAMLWFGRKRTVVLAGREMQ
jgi:branched-chain amino acid transport system permease protein